MDRQRATEKIRELLAEAIAAQKALMETQLDTIALVAQAIVTAVRSGGKVIIFGNGGSAADSQHVAAELIGRFKKERPPIPAVSLTVNTSTLTALSNDYGYDVSFLRQIEGIGKAGDVAIGISTSGNAKNVRRALEAAKGGGLKTVAMTGQADGAISEKADITLKVPSSNTPRIQEAHITAAHIICQLVEEELY